MAKTDDLPVDPRPVDIGEGGEWETVVEESGKNIEFSEVGSQFIGTYIGTAHIVPPNGGDEFDQQRFRDGAGTLYSVNGGFKLREGLKDVPEGATVRITYMGEVDTGQPSPMRDYRVEVRKN